MAREGRIAEESENRSIPLSAQGNQGKMFNRLALSLLPINLNCCGAKKGERKETEGRRSSACSAVAHLFAVIVALVVAVAFSLFCWRPHAHLTTLCPTSPATTPCGLVVRNFSAGLRSLLLLHAARCKLHARGLHSMFYGRQPRRPLGLA